MMCYILCINTRNVITQRECDSVKHARVNPRASCTGLTGYYCIPMDSLRFGPTHHQHLPVLTMLTK